LLYISLREKNKDTDVDRIFDAHCDTVLHFTGEHGSYNFLKENNHAHVDLPRLKKGGIKAQIFALFIEPCFKSGGALQRCLRLLNSFYETVDGCGNEIITVYDYPQFIEVTESGKIAALLLVEGGEALEGELKNLRKLFFLGVRGLGLTWNFENEISGAAMEGPGSKGLKSFGKKVVREMNRLGMIIDLAHISPKGFQDVLAVTDAPVIVSHANAAALCNHPRNLTDEQMKLLRDNKGVLGISFYPPFIDHREAGLDRLLDHFEHAADILGVDYLGIGSDFDGIDIVLKELRDVSFLPRLTAGLRKRGFSETEIRKILFENFLRIVKETVTGEGNEVC